MQSTVVKRSIVINGHKTSVSLEDEFWHGLKEIVRAQHTTLAAYVASIDDGRNHGNLSSAIRLCVLAHFCPDAASPPLQPALAPTERPPAKVATVEVGRKFDQFRRLPGRPGGDRETMTD